MTKKKKTDAQSEETLQPSPELIDQEIRSALSELRAQMLMFSGVKLEDLQNEIDKESGLKAKTLRINKKKILKALSFQFDELDKKYKDFLKSIKATFKKLDEFEEDLDKIYELYPFVFSNLFDFASKYLTGYKIDTFLEFSEDHHAFQLLRELTGDYRYISEYLTQQDIPTEIFKAKIEIYIDSYSSKGKTRMSDYPPICYLVWFLSNVAGLSRGESMKRIEYINREFNPPRPLSLVVDDNQDKYWKVYYMEQWKKHLRKKRGN